jgi:anti-sigma factor RsiW
MELSAYFDNELDAAETAQVKQHLEHCAVCRKKLEGMQRLRDGFAQLAMHRVAPRRSILQGLLRLLTRTN